MYIHVQINDHFDKFSFNKTSQASIFIIKYVTRSKIQHIQGLTILIYFQEVVNSSVWSDMPSNAKEVSK